MPHTHVLVNNKLHMPRWSHNDKSSSHVLAFASTLLCLHNNDTASLNPLDREPVFKQNTALFNIVCL